MLCHLYTIGTDGSPSGFTYVLSSVACGAAISDWERGKSKVHADDRRVLVGLINIFSTSRKLKVSPKTGESYSNPPSSKSRPELLSPHFVFASSLFESPEEFQNWLAAARDGPPPSWPRIVTASLRRLSDRLSAAKVLRGLIWLWIWIIGYALIAPSLRWPFADEATTLVSILLYVCGSLILPLCAGLLINTDNNPFWQQKAAVSRVGLRLYVYQGAFIGFHIGYFVVLVVNLLLYFLHVSFLPWLEFALLGIPLLMSYIAAQVVPHNLWRAYGRLNLADGAIFFVFLILGPLWGWFFAEFNKTLLAPITGIFVILSALTLLASLMTWQFRQTQRIANDLEGNNARR